MRINLFNSFAFVKNNPALFYSLMLIVLIPLAFFYNTYRIIAAFEKDIDKITHQKAILAETIIGVILEQKIQQPSELQELVSKIQANSDEISSINIFLPVEESGAFELVASSDPNSIGEEISNAQNSLAWSEAQGIAFLAKKGDERFWNITKTFSVESGKKTGLIAMAFSLRESDEFIARTITQSYVILIVTVLIVVLLVSNQARLFGHVLALSRLEEFPQLQVLILSLYWKPSCDIHRHTAE